MKKYLKGYALGVLFGLIFTSPSFVTKVPLSFKQHWIALIIFIPAIVYFCLSYSEYNEISFKKENIKKGVSFVIGIILSFLAVNIIWGLPV